VRRLGDRRTCWRKSGVKPARLARRAYRAGFARIANRTSLDGATVRSPGSGPASLPLRIAWCHNRPPADCLRPGVEVLGTSCKFLQAVSRPGAISHERHRPVAPCSRVQITGVQPALSAALATGSVRRSAVTSNFLRRIVGVMFLRVNSNPPTRCAHRLESEAQQSSASNVSRSPAGQHGEREGAPALGRRLTLLRIRSKRGCNLELQRAARSQHCGLRERRPYR